MGQRRKDRLLYAAEGFVLSDAYKQLFSVVACRPCKLHIDRLGFAWHMMDHYVLVFQRNTRCKILHKILPFISQKNRIKCIFTAFTSRTVFQPSLRCRECLDWHFLFLKRQYLSLPFQCAEQRTMCLRAPYENLMHSDGGCVVGQVKLSLFLWLNKMKLLPANGKHDWFSRQIRCAATQRLV